MSPCSLTGALDQVVMDLDAGGSPHAVEDERAGPGAVTVDDLRPAIDEDVVVELTVVAAPVVVDADLLGTGIDNRHSCNLSV